MQQAVGIPHSCGQIGSAFHGAVAALPNTDADMHDINNAIAGIHSECRWSSRKIGYAFFFQCLHGSAGVADASQCRSRMMSSVNSVLNFTSEMTIPCCAGAQGSLTITGVDYFYFGVAWIFSTERTARSLQPPEWIISTWEPRGFFCYTRRHLHISHAWLRVKISCIQAKGFEREFRFLMMEVDNANDKSR